MKMYLLTLLLFTTHPALHAQQANTQSCANVSTIESDNYYGIQESGQSCGNSEINGTAPPNLGMYRGGSNFNWYKVVNCDREPYGVIVNHHTQTAAIRSRLASMRAAGQARLRLMIFHGNGLASGTLMNSAGGTLSAQNRSNLQNLIADFRSYGFGEIQVAFGPQGQNNPLNWSSINYPMAEENWQIINQVHQLLDNSGILIKYDLGNEMMTSSTSNPRYRYMRYIWTRYYPLYGHLADTVGFSFASGAIDAISNMDNIYGNHSYPAMADVHIYPTGGNSAGDLVYAAAHNLKNIGPFPGQYRWIIGEAHFNNQVDAQSMSDQILALGQNDSKPFFLLQWPIDASNPSCVVSDVSPFHRYITEGF